MNVPNTCTAMACLPSGRPSNSPTMLVGASSLACQDEVKQKQKVSGNITIYTPTTTEPSKEMVEWPLWHRGLERTYLLKFKVSRDLFLLFGAGAKDGY